MSNYDYLIFKQFFQMKMYRNKMVVYILSLYLMIYLFIFGKNKLFFLYVTVKLIIFMFYKTIRNILFERIAIIV